MTSKLNRKQAEHVRAWLTSQIDPTGLPDLFWNDMAEHGIDREAARQYVQERYYRICVDFGQPQFTCWYDKED